MTSQSSPVVTVVEKTSSRTIHKVPCAETTSSKINRHTRWRRFFPDCQIGGEVSYTIYMGNGTMKLIAVTRIRHYMAKVKERMVAGKEQVAWRILVQYAPNPVVSLDAEIHQ